MPRDPVLHALVSRSTPPDLLLADGQTWHMWLEAGSVIQTYEGLVNVREAPGWLAEQVLQVERRLGAGEVHVAHQAGWVTLHARRRSRLRVRLAVATPSLLEQAGRGSLAMARQVLRLVRQWLRPRAAA